MSQADGRAIGLLVFLVLVTSLPFVHRAYFVDDYYHVTMAAGLLDHPGRPYDFRSNDTAPNTLAWERGHFPRMVNPPVFHYFLALVMTMVGTASWKLRTASLLFSAISVIACYFVGKRVVARPLAAATLLAVTPCFWLTSYSLLIDGPLLAFFLCTMWASMLGWEKRRVGVLILAGLLMGLTCLVKYFGVLIFAVIFLWHWRGIGLKRSWTDYTAYPIALLVLLGWGMWNIKTYGQMHLLATLPRGAYTSASLASYLPKLAVTGSFMSGSFIFLVASTALLYRRMPLVLLALLALAALFVPRLIGPGGFPALTTGLLLLFLLSSVSFLTLVLREAPSHLFLALWWFLGLLELIMIMPWTAVRYYLLILPPTIWLFQIMLDRLSTRWAWPVLWAVTGCAGLGLACADYAQANVIYSLLPALAQAPSVSSTAHKYVLADTFTGYDPYLEPLGWHDAFPTTSFQPGDLLLIPRLRSSSWWAVPSPQRLHFLGRLDFRSRWPVRVMDIPASAGFYASVWGALPFAITSDPLERFELYQVRAAKDSSQASAQGPS